MSINANGIAGGGGEIALALIEALIAKNILTVEDAKSSSQHQSVCQPWWGYQQ